MHISYYSELRVVSFFRMLFSIHAFSYILEVVARYTEDLQYYTAPCTLAKMLFGLYEDK